MSCYISSKCQSPQFGKPFIIKQGDVSAHKLQYNQIYNNIQQLLIYNKFSKTKNGEFIEDKDKVTRSLAIQEYTAMVETNYFINILYYWVNIFLLVILLLTFIMHAKHECIINYVIVIVGVIISQSFTIYNKLID